MNRGLTKRKGFNEIYFVLYLVAVILLIPEKKQVIDFFSNENNYSKSEVFISPEKYNLNCIISRINSKSIITDLDSINIINILGDVIDIEYSIEIQKNNISQVISLNNNSHNSKFISIEKIDNNLRFLWKPDADRVGNENYNINIMAVAKVNNEDEVETVYLKTSFGLNIFVNESLPLIANNDSLIQSIINNNTIFNQTTQAEVPNNISLDINPEKITIKGIAYEKWTNRIRVIGLNLKSELASSPVIEIQSEDESLTLPIIESISANTISLSGNIPKFGKSTVSILLTRASDNKQIKSSFDLLSVQLEEPVYSAEVYPSTELYIEPNLPIMGKSISAVVKNGDEILIQSNDGSGFKFQVADKDTNEILILERYIDNKLIGKTYQIKVLNLPEPKIIDIRKKDEKTYIIKVRTYGFFQGERNTSKIQVLNSEDNIVEKFGLYKEDKYSTIQVFEIQINKASNSNNHSIDIIAYDKRNYKSKKIKIGEK